MVVEAVLTCVLAFAAFVAILLFLRGRRRAAQRPILAAWEPVFTPGEVAAMFAAGQITAAERDRLLAILQEQQSGKEADTPPLGPPGFPVQPLEKARRAASSG